MLRKGRLEGVVGGCGQGEVSQIFHSVFMTFCFCRSEGCENLPQTCYSPKVEDLGRLPLALSATRKLGARPEGPPGSFSNTRHTCHNPPGLLATVGCIFRELSASWEASLGKHPPSRSCPNATTNAGQGKPQDSTNAKLKTARTQTSRQSKTQDCASARSYTHSKAGGRSTSGENPV